MLTEDEHRTLPTGEAFLDLQARAFSNATEFTAAFAAESGKQLPATVNGLGTVLSLLYRTACCAWGCSGGAHQLEWLSGRVVNQDNAAFHLVRSASYDEAFMLGRGIGEIANPSLQRSDSDRPAVPRGSFACPPPRGPRFLPPSPA